jgi:hypothetical protein
MPLLEISQSRQQGCGRAVRKKSCSQGAANDFHAGGRGGGVALRSVLPHKKNGAAHRENFDTPPPQGSCQATFVSG